MFERYTEKARRVIFFARYEASQYGSPYIETEHLLLGLLREDHKLKMRILSEQGSAESIRRAIEAKITVRERFSTSVEVPLSAECKRILNMSAEEAERLGNRHVGTEHLLLGILREEKCFAASLLNERGLTLFALREILASSPTQREVSDAEQVSEGHMVSLSQLVNAWSVGNAAAFARFFATDGQFVDLQGNLSVGRAQIAEKAHLIFKSQGWAECLGRIEDVQFVGMRAVMAALAWEAAEKSEEPNPGCARMTVILTQTVDGWSVARIQATGLEPQARSAAS